MQVLYIWVDCLNIELARSRIVNNREEPPNYYVGGEILDGYLSDEDLFFERLNQQNLDKFRLLLNLRYYNIHYRNYSNLPR